MKVIAKVFRGEIDLNNFKEKIKKLKDGNYEINVKKARAIRSINQNNYYWGVLIYELHNLFNCEVPPTQIHELLGYKFLTTRYEHPITGDLIEKITSTTKLNTKQMEEYLDRCRKYAMEEYNHRILLPNETEYNY